MGSGRVMATRSAPSAARTAPASRRRAPGSHPAVPPAAPPSNRAGQALLGGGIGPVMRACAGGCGALDQLGIARSATSAAPAIMRDCGCGCGGSCQDEPSVARSADGPGGESTAAEGLGSAASVLARPGRPIDRRTRRRMESGFGRDLRHVRIHTDREAARSARALHAAAYTVGDHIVFGAGRYAPDSRAGTRLLAHELTHTVQQRERPHVQRAGTVSRPGDRHEREADRVADAVAAGGRAPSVLISATPGAIHLSLLDDALGLAGRAASGVAGAARRTAGAAADAARWTAGAATGAARWVASGAVDLAGRAVDTVVGGIKAVYDLAMDIARAIGGIVRVRGCGITITVPRVEVPYSLTMDVPLPAASVTVPVAIGVVPLTGVVNAYGVVYVNLSASPQLSVQLGPAVIHGARLGIDWCAPSFVGSAGLTLTGAAALGGEVRGGIGGEVGLEVNVPVGPVVVPVPIPLASLDAGVVGAVLGTAVGTVSTQVGLGYGGGVFSFSGRRSGDFGAKLSAGFGAFGSVSALGHDLCTVYWPWLRDEWTRTWSVDSSVDLRIGRGGFDLALGATAMTPGRVDFDDFDVDLATDVLTDDCALLERVCRVLYAMGVMPSQNGVTWANGGYRPWDGPALVYPIDPGIGSRAKCRGACGPDCDTCDDAGEHRECVELGDRHAWLVYPGLLDCPEHPACKEHDACYDHYGSGGPEGAGPFLGRRVCDLECACTHPVASCVGWIFGSGGTGRIHFSEEPYLVEGCEGHCPAGSTEADGSDRFELCLPRVELDPGLTVTDRLRRTTGNIPLYSEPIPIGWGWIQANVWARGDLTLGGSASVGPVYLDDVCLTVDPSGPHYAGAAELHVPASLAGYIVVTGTLGAGLDYVCVLPLAEAEGSLSGRLDGRLSTEFVDRVEVGCDGGQINIENDAWFDTELALGASLQAALRVSLLFWEVYSDTWDLAGITWNRRWRHHVGILQQSGAGAALILPVLAVGAVGAAELLRFLLGHESDQEFDEPTGRSLGWLTSLCGPPDVPTDDGECGSPSLPLTQVAFSGSADRGETVVARPLTRCPGNTSGSQPDSSIFGDVWERCIKPAGQTGRWVRAHLLHGETSGSGGRDLHGPGDTPRNLILSDKSINGRMRTRVEGPAIRAAYDDNKVLWYEVTVDHFDDSGHERFFGERVHMAWGEHDPATGSETTNFSDWISSGKGYQPPPCPNF